MSIAIKVENLTKAYQLGSFGTGTISRDLERLWAKARRKEDPFLKIGEENDRTSKSSSDIVYSLKDMNFEIGQGDAVGIIGRNGAGKSTLLKILSRITAPTLGTVKVKGRIASLLEVGTGFHPELTGRENIYLNGAILGMRKKEITRKFDEIINFAGVDRYIDTPVKRYSSGMYVRLAFAVAAHLESEILIVDEVLAVGDAEFQKKCLGKMGEVSKGEGRTVLFVSHNIGAIMSLCNLGLFLENGKLIISAPIDKAINAYNNSQIIKKDYGVKVEINTSSPNNLWIYKSQLNLIVSWESQKFKNGCYCDIAFYTVDGTKIFSLESAKLMSGEKIEPKYNSIVFKVDNIGLVDREIKIDVGFKKEVLGPYFLLIENALEMSIPPNHLPIYKDNSAIIVPNASLELRENYGL
jgi:lipopolysaccharide transport system ATP-binding protein